MLILGVNAFHADSAACLMRDGKLIAAVEEERFRRVKHWAGFPTEAIKWCLACGGARLVDVDQVALNQDTRANMWKRVQYLATSHPDLGLAFDRLRTRKARAGVDTLLAELFPAETFRGKVQPVEHHLAHLASAFHLSPFEDAVAVSVDGFGDFVSTAWGIGRGTKIEIDRRVYFPHSLGILYQALTQYIGFCDYGDEYKVMGLAPYGEPKHLAKLHELIEVSADGAFELNVKYFRHHKESLPQQWENGAPVFDDLFSPELECLLGPCRTKGAPLEQYHCDIARSTQALYEEVFFNVIKAARRHTGLKSLVLAGGCANNSVANGKLRRETPFTRVYVHAAPGDAGGAIGAACVVWHRFGGQARSAMEHACWGPSFDDATCLAALEAHARDLETEKCEVMLISDEAELSQRTSAAVAVGKVVGWFQGRMEWGPRALGNRSIIGDPRRADMRDILNAKIKRRESFRPFAPSILREYVGDWFEEDDDVPFMTQVFQIRKEKRSQIPAVTHVDGSGRLQTVSREANPRFAHLIDAFHELTGIPMVLNTSFNENEPIVCRPEEALDCFLRTKMDILVLGNRFVERRP